MKNRVVTQGQTNDKFLILNASHEPCSHKYNSHFHFKYSIEHKHIITNVKYKYEIEYYTVNIHSRIKYCVGFQTELFSPLGFFNIYKLVYIKKRIHFTISEHQSLISLFTKSKKKPTKFGSTKKFAKSAP